MYFTHLGKVEPLRTEEGPGTQLPLGIIMAWRSQLKQRHVTLKQRWNLSGIFNSKIRCGPFFCKWILAILAAIRVYVIALSPRVIPYSHPLTCSGSGGPGHWPLLNLQSVPAKHELSSPLSTGQLLMSVRIGRCRDAFTMEAPEKRAKSQPLAYLEQNSSPIGHRQQLSDAGTSKLLL